VIKVGDVLRGKYRLESSIGKGGMGEVFCAFDTKTLRRVAVKVVTRTALGEVLMARLQREAIAAVRVRSEYVPQLLDVDTTEEGEVFLVMELLRGQTLTARLKQRGNLTWDETLALGRDVLHGLIDAHAAGVVHRDLKPSNIFVELARPGLGERAKVLDFGVCKLDAPDGEKLTSTGESVGTVAYMAPEQIRGASKVDERADLYSFATVMFEALCGRMPHDAAGQMAMLASKLERAPLRVVDCSLVPVPEGLQALLGRMLARDPNERLASATELLHAWESLGPANLEPHTQPAIDVPPDVVVDGPSIIGGTQTSLTTGPSTRAGRAPSRGPLLVAGAAVVMAIGIFVTMLSAARTPGGDLRTAAASTVVLAAPNPDPSSPSPAPEPVRPSGDPAATPTAPQATPPTSAGQTDWTTSIPTLDLTSDAGFATLAAPPPKPRRYYGRPAGKPSAAGTPRHGSTEPRLDDKPRY